MIFGTYTKLRNGTWGVRTTSSAAVATWAKSVDLTPEKAREWLEKYRGCEGTSDYELVVKMAEEAQ